MTSAPSELRLRSFGSRPRTLGALSLWLLPPALAAGTVGGLSAANGGYFGGTRAWAALALLWLALLALLLRSDVATGALGLVFAGALVLFAGWTALSILWTSSVTLTVSDSQKMLVYVGLVVAALLVLRRRSVPSVLAGTLIGISAVCAYALATRLFPERLGTFDPLAGYRLETPTGYWNGLGLLAAMGALLAAGLAARAERPWGRAAAAAPLPLLMATLFFTFSRGAWVALAVGFLAAWLLDPRRLQLLAATLVLAPFAALVVWLGNRSHALTSTTGLLADATHEGHRLAVWVVVLGAGAAGVAAVFGLVEARWSAPRVLRVAFASLLALAVVAGAAAVWSRYGSPSSLARRGYDSFLASPKGVNGNLAGRLLDLSSNGRVDLWHAAWREFVHHPIAGTGAGTFQVWWYMHRPYDAHVLDAHGLYQQTAAELGVVGFVLLLVLLAAPLVAAVWARRNPIVPVALGAYVAFLVHNAYDWDWQLTGIGAAGLLCATALVVCARPTGAVRALALPVRVVAATATLALLCFAFVTMMGNVPLDSAQAAADQGNWAASASDAHKAKTWAPWSSEPLRLLGEAELAQAKIVTARNDFTSATAKDPQRWQLWLDLALTSTGAEKRHALARAERLDPRDSTIASLAGKQLIIRSGR